MAVDLSNVMNAFAYVKDPEELQYIKRRPRVNFANLRQNHNAIPYQKSLREFEEKLKCDPKIDEKSRSLSRSKLDRKLYHFLRGFKESNNVHASKYDWDEYDATGKYSVESINNKDNCNIPSQLSQCRGSSMNSPFHEPEHSYRQSISSKQSSTISPGFHRKFSVHAKPNPAKLIHGRNSRVPEVIHASYNESIPNGNRVRKTSKADVPYGSTLPKWPKPFGERTPVARSWAEKKWVEEMLEGHTNPPLYSHWKEEPPVNEFNKISEKTPKPNSRRHTLVNCRVYSNNEEDDEPSNFQSVNMTRDDHSPILMKNLRRQPNTFHQTNRREREEDSPRIEERSPEPHYFMKKKQNMGQSRNRQIFVEEPDSLSANNFSHNAHKESRMTEKPIYMMRNHDKEVGYSRNNSMKNQSDSKTMINERRYRPSIIRVKKNNRNPNQNTERPNVKVDVERQSINPNIPENRNRKNNENKKPVRIIKIDDMKYQHSSQLPTYHEHICGNTPHQINNNRYTNKTNNRLTAHDKIFRSNTNRKDRNYHIDTRSQHCQTTPSLDDIPNDSQMSYVQSDHPLRVDIMPLHRDAELTQEYFDPETRTSIRIEEQRKTPNFIYVHPSHIDNNIQKIIHNRNKNIDHSSNYQTYEDSNIGSKDRIVPIEKNNMSDGLRLHKENDNITNNNTKLVYSYQPVNQPSIIKRPSPSQIGRKENGKYYDLYDRKMNDEHLVDIDPQIYAPQTINQRNIVQYRDYEDEDERINERDEDDEKLPTRNYRSVSVIHTRPRFDVLTNGDEPSDNAIVLDVYVHSAKGDCQPE
ncbi:hypothetical protein SNEBB_008310 [Seison nebaliae]|nr:hypothetical protein SNEBB_008310 [Seison nebaliae]